MTHLPLILFIIIAVISIVGLIFADYRTEVKLLFGVLFIGLSVAGYFMFSANTERLKEKNSRFKNLIEFLKAGEQAHQPNGLAISKTTLNLRAYPSTKAKILARIPKAGRVSYWLLDFNGPKGNWLRVSYNGKIGWADGRYLRPSNPSEVDKSVAIGFKTSLLLLFRGKSFGEAILDWLLAVPLSFLVNALSLMFRFDEIPIHPNSSMSLDFFTFAAPAFYLLWLNRGIIYAHPTPLEAVSIMAIVIVISYIIDLPVSKLAEFVFRNLGLR